MKPGPEGTVWGSMAGLPRGPTVCNVGIMAFIFMTGLALFGLGTQHTTDRAKSSLRLIQLKSGHLGSTAAACSTSAGNTSQVINNGKAADAYSAAALQNLTDLNERLLSISVPFFGVTQASQGRGNATNLWQLLEPIISCPPGQPVSQYGPGGDGSKLLCKLPEHEGGPCVIYSLGSNGDYSFEHSVLKATSCTVHTFDCTYNGASQGPRHSYYKWCIGDAKHGPDFRSWANITTTLGHSKVDVLKIDIEGHEYKVFSEWTSKEPTLPHQVAVEFHFEHDDIRYPFMAHSGAEMVLAYMHLGQLGYASFAQDINAHSPYCCSEVSFLRVV